ncbi:MAG: SRPBCC family protein [Mycobacterium sp.]
MGMALRSGAVSVDRLVAAPTEQVWRLLTDVRHWPSWGPSVRRAELDSGQTRLSEGASGTVWTAAGVRMPFRITEFDPQRRWCWTVAGVTATGHDLIPVDGGCRVRFDMPWWAVAYLPVCAVGLDRLAKLAQAPQ